MWYLHISCSISSVIDVPAHSLSGQLSKGIEPAGFVSSVQVKSSNTPIGSFPRSNTVRGTTSPTFVEIAKRELNRKSLGDCKCCCCCC